MSQSAEVPVKPGSPLPGIEVKNHPLPVWYDGPPRERIVTDDARFHAAYTQTIGRNADGFSVRESIGCGRRAVTGVEVRNYLRGSLGFWLCSQGSITEDDTIHYRQTAQHHTISFTPDRTSGLIIVYPDRCITAAAYQVAGTDGQPQTWSQNAVRHAVTEALRPGPIDWPDGWALLMPDETIRFARGGFPWAPGDEYTATPVSVPAQWGAPCAECNWRKSEHDPNRLWGNRCRKYRCPVTN
ncbi:hypothetical protein [Streptomyces albipurpureus]|uniref:Uncharacterized protein n=1 Tax=Streptomyces albipurpureus TaxID=2897419 RepID=A0ABT0ULB1_9ACTN|nr:hypothetical protein [Streptomyces sp. CWNU-1]MCM2388809.1 hypothetical protein [Streptomyces sp. CWNU-1]